MLVFEDSNSCRWIPVEQGVTTQRYPSEDQWPEIMQGEFGEVYEVMVDALSGRTTDVDDPTPPYE